MVRSEPKEEGNQASGRQSRQKNLRFHVPKNPTLQLARRGEREEEENPRVPKDRAQEPAANRDHPERKAASVKTVSRGGSKTENEKNREDGVHGETLLFTVGILLQPI
jgi:hypothetical protein